MTVIGNPEIGVIVSTDGLDPGLPEGAPAEPLERVKEAAL